MKQILVFLVLFLSYKGCFGQVALANDKENLAYLGLDNPFNFAVFGFPCSDVDVNVDNGKLLKVPNQCGKLIYQPAQSGAATFRIFGRKNGQLQLIDVVPYRVIHPPLPTFLFFSAQQSDEPDPITGECCGALQIKNGQHITLTDIKTPIGMGSIMVNFNYDIKYTITRYNYAIKRNNQIIKKGTNKGARCNDALISDMKALQINDTIVFESIYCEFNNKEHLLPDFEMVIKQ